MVIRCIDARHAGASHDSAVWALSKIRPYLEWAHNQSERMWLLGIINLFNLCCLLKIPVFVFIYNQLVT